MSLAETLSHHPRWAPDLPISQQGLASPRVQYVVACLLARRERPAPRLALRALRPYTELGPSPWTALDPSLVRLRQRGSATASAFFRIIQGPGPVIEHGELKVTPIEVVLGDRVNVTARVIALPLTQNAGEAQELDVQFGFGDAHTDYEAWKTWSPMNFTQQVATHLRYKQEWKPATPGKFLLLVRCRVGKGPWSYVDELGYDITDPAKTGRSNPIPVEVKAPKPDEVKTNGS